MKYLLKIFTGFAAALLTLILSACVSVLASHLGIQNIVNIFMLIISFVIVVIVCHNIGNDIIDFFLGEKE